MRICITGSSRGVGKAVALGFAAKGAHLTLIGRKSSAQAEVLEQIRSLDTNRAPEFIECDFSESLQVESAGALLAQQDAFDVVIHNAGIIERASVEKCSLESWQRQLYINLTAPARLTQSVLPAMKQAGSGRILFVSSISAVLGSAQQGAYHAAKAGILGFMRCLAVELSDSGLMTMALLPGAIDTDMLQGSGYPPRMTPEDVFQTLQYYSTQAPLAHNGASVEMFGI